MLLSDAALQSFGERRFRELLDSVAHAKQPEAELTRVLSAPGFLTLPLPALLPEIKKMLGPKQRTSGTGGSPALQIARMLPRLSALQRDMLFERFVRPEVKERFAFDILERQVEANKIDGVLMNRRFHRSSKDYWDAVAAIERSIGPEQAEALAVRIDGLLSPERSADKYVRPREAELQGLRRSIDVSAFDWLACIGGRAMLLLAAWPLTQVDNQIPVLSAQTKNAKRRTLPQKPSYLQFDI